jgi:peptidoglycan DL-endopeptidase LytE
LTKRRYFMMRRRIFLWMGLGVLFISLGLCREGLTRETYQVAKGDTLFSIAKKLDVTVPALRAANKIKGNSIKPDQLLVVPSANATTTSKVNKNSKSRRPTPPSGERVYRVVNGDTLARISKKTGVSIEDLRELNGLQGNGLKIGQKLALNQKSDGQAAAAEPVRDRMTLNPDEEEEEDGGITSDTAWAAIEKRNRESVELLGRWNNPEEPKLLVRVAMGFLGAPYRLGGSSVKGLDCSGFVKKIYHFFNIDLPRTAFEQAHIGLRVAREELIEGDLIFFNTRRKLGHVGIYIGNDEFVHASSRKQGVRVDNLNTPYYDRRFVKAVRLKGSDVGL